MFWMTLAVLAIVAGVVLRRRRALDAPPDEPWRASLDKDDDEPLDLEEIRRAEAEWAADSDPADAAGDEDWP